MKTIIIIFPGEWIGYSPTVLNLVRILENNFNIRVICFEYGMFKLDSFRHDKRFLFIRINPLFYKILAKLLLRDIYILLRLVRQIKKLGEFHAIIGVDSIGTLTASFCSKNIHMLSLEIEKGILFKLIVKKKIKSLIIQSIERKQYLFKDNIGDMKVFYIPNSPIYTEFKNSVREKFSKYKLIYLGNIHPQHGVYDSIRSLYFLPKEFSLTLKGFSVYKKVDSYIESQFKDLIREKRLIIDREYIEIGDIQGYLFQFSIGLCFYQFKSPLFQTFNYISSPSGKVCDYYNAHLPVVGSDILGLKSVEEFRAGILLDEVNPENIAKAIICITNDYDLYSEAAKNAAQKYDFKKHAVQFRDYLNSL